MLTPSVPWGQTLKRWVDRKGSVVTWGNMVGVYCGQSGAYRFGSVADTKLFAAYAGANSAPALDDDSLKKAGIPLPIERKEL